MHRFEEQPFGVETTADTFLFHIGDDTVGTGHLCYSGVEDDYEVTVIQTCPRINFWAQNINKLVQHLRTAATKQIYVLVGEDAPLKISAVASSAVFSVFVAPLAE